MRALVLMLALLIPACSISPVISDPGVGDDRRGAYGGCRKAARDYCRHVVDAGPGELEPCVAEHTLACVSGDR